jgi:hypothetical protein
MLPKLTIVVVLALMCLLAACQKPMSPDEARNSLTGEWKLVVKSSCNDLGIRSDRLLLHSNGQLEQHLEMADGKKFDSPPDSKWSFVPDHSVSLDERFNVSKSGATTNVEKRHEILIVEFTKPPSILLNPDQSCFYQQISTGKN